MARQHVGMAVISEGHAVWSRHGGCTAWEIVITVSISHSQALHHEWHSAISSRCWGQASFCDKWAAGCGSRLHPVAEI